MVHPEKEDPDVEDVAEGEDDKEALSEGGGDVSEKATVRIDDKKVEWSSKNWDTILKDYSSGEDEDAHDSLNIVSVQKNARRVSELLHSMIPGLDPEECRNLPKGMNGADFFRNKLSESLKKQGRHSS
jgi:hypothetical protein